MRKFKSLLLIAALICITTAASCPHQRAEYNTIFAVEKTASAAYDGYVDMVIAGTLPTNDVPAVSLKFNQIQAACTLAAATSQAGTNAIAPAQLTAELVDLSAFIASLQTKHK